MKKLSTFKKFLLIYTAILVLVIVAVDIFIWSKLSDYEKQLEAEKSASAESNLNSDISVTISPTVTSIPTPAPSLSPTPTEVPKSTYVVEVPENVTIYVNEEQLNTEEILPIEVETDTFEVLYTFSETYSEYADIENKVEIPVIYHYEFQDVEESLITAKDANGIDVELEASIDESGKIKYCSGFISDDSYYETIRTLAFESIEKYALFCTNDGAVSALAPYFPENSKYLAVIGQMDNTWYAKHDEPPTFSEHTVLDYVGYSDSLVYVKITLKQTLNTVWSNEITEITHPMWFIKLNGEWKIAAIEF